MRCKLRVALVSVSLGLSLVLAGGLSCRAKDKGDFERTGGKHYPGKSIEYLSSLKPKQRKKITFPPYDQGGGYYYAHGDYEKARQYWMTALQIAEREVPAERAGGLSSETEQATCSLINHLMYFLKDSHYKPPYFASQGATPQFTPKGLQPLRDPDLRKVYLYNLKGQMRDFEEDLRFWDRLKNFARRSLGEGHNCMRVPTNNIEVEFNRKIMNTREMIARLERELGVSSSDSKQTPWGGGFVNPTGKNDNNPNQGQVENPWP